MLRCSWSADGTKVSAGSADRFVYIWDTTSRRIVYKLPANHLTQGDNQQIDQMILTGPQAETEAGMINIPVKKFDY